MVATIALGAGVLSENPRNSWFRVMQAMLHLPSIGCADRDYDACTVGGARAKKQRITTSIEELYKTRAQCHHIRAKGEWKKELGPDGRLRYPT